MKSDTIRTIVLNSSMILLIFLLSVGCEVQAPAQEPTQEPSQETTQEPTQEAMQEPTHEPTQEIALEPTDEVNKEFNGERALELVKIQISFGYRIPGTEAHTKMGDWIIETLQALGWDVEEQIFPYMGFVGRNIIAKAGTGDGDWVILGAHYDTRPVSDRDDDNPWEPVPGANDGGSGVAVLLELARVIKLEELQSPVWLVFFDLEDSGGIDEMEWIVGSSFFVENLVEHPDAVIIVDMVGDADLQLYYEKNSDIALMGEIWQIAKEKGFSGFIPIPNHSMLDDHTPFLRRGIPAIDILDFDYPYWHTTEDTIDKVSAESLEQVGQTLMAWLGSN